MSSLTTEHPAPRARDMLIRKQPAPIDMARSLPLQARSAQRPWEGGHSLGWLGWLIGGLLMVGQLNHPLYLLIVWACCVVVWSTCAKPGPLGRAFRLFMYLGLWIFGMHLFFSIFTVSILRGQTVLWVLPTWKLPDILGGLQIGGLVSLEQLIYGAVRGLKLWTMIMLFGTFNACVNHYRLIRRAPGFLIHLGLIVVISLAFVPQTLLRLKAIRDAQRLRGHRFHSWRDALPLLVPLISSGLEQALTLAEAMEARGYGRIVAATHSTNLQRYRWAMAAGVMGILGGCISIFFYTTTLTMIFGTSLILVACLSLFWSWRGLSKLIRRTTYSREQWLTRHSLVLIGLACATMLLFWLNYTGINLDYRIFPRITSPDFAPLVAIPLLTLSLPTWLWPQNNQKSSP